MINDYEERTKPGSFYERNGGRFKGREVMSRDEETIYVRSKVDALAFPTHEASLHLTHNQHKANYETVSQAEASGSYGPSAWVSEDQRQKAIKNDSVWELVWYPDTPIGSHTLLAYDLDVLLERARAV
jgi:hypothetical protein